MIEHPVEDHANAGLVPVANEVTEVVVGAEAGIDLAPQDLLRATGAKAADIDPARYPDLVQEVQNCHG